MILQCRRYQRVVSLVMPRVCKLLGGYGGHTGASHGGPAPSASSSLALAEPVVELSVELSVELYVELSVAGGSSKWHCTCFTYDG